MTVLLQVLYWASLVGAGGGVGVVLFLMLFNTGRAVPFPQVAVSIISGLAAGWILWWAVQTGLTDGRWMPGILICLLAVVVFAVMMVGGFLLFVEMRWQ